MPTLLMPVSGSRITAKPCGDVLAGVLLVVGADRQFLDIDVVAERAPPPAPAPVSTITGSIGWAWRAAHSLTNCLDVAVLHAERVAQPLEARVHVGDQRDLRALDVLEDHQREFAVALQPLQDAGDAEFRIDLLA